MSTRSQLDGQKLAEIRNEHASRALARLSSVAESRLEVLVEGAFDYKSIEPSVARFLRGQAERIRRQGATTVLHIGSALVEAKRYLSHGNFLIWVESEVGITARTAQLYMRAALWSKKKGKAVSGFPLSKRRCRDCFGSGPSRLGGFRGRGARAPHDDTL